MMNRVLPTLRKCAALVNRDDSSGVIVQRIIGTDPTILAHLEWIFSSMIVSDDFKGPPKLNDVIELFGWHIVREVVLVVLLHEVHRESALKIGIRAEELDRRALMVVTGAVELGASGIAGLFANVGEVGLALHDSHKNLLKTNYAQYSDLRVADERSAYGFDHGILGSYMLSEVDFPAEVCDQVFEHTTIGTPIWVAEQLADSISDNPELDVNSSENLLWQRLRFSPSRTERIRGCIAASADLPYLAFVDSLTKIA